LSLAVQVAWGVMALGTVHNAFPSIARGVKEGNLACVFTSPHSPFAFLRSIFLSSSFVLELSHRRLDPTIAHNNGIEPPCPSLPVRSQHHVGEEATWMVVDRVRWEGTVWNHFAHRIGAWQYCPLLILCTGWACILDVLLLPLATGELRSLASPPDVACHRLGGDLHPLMRNVRGCMTIGAHVLTLLHAMSLWEESTPPRGLLLPEQ
jgi:hypothetical protein